MQNPFESGHIKNYILLYTSVVLIMILFFMASTLFHDVQKVDKKIFNTQISEAIDITKNENGVQESNQTSKFKLLDRKF